MNDEADRLISPDKRGEDLDAALRPQTLDDFTGQKAARANLKVFIEAARGRGEALDHVLFVGPPGLGKTTLAQIVARELGVELEIVEVDIRAGDNRAAEFLARNSNAKVPVLEDGNFVLWESRAICAFLAGIRPEAGLYPDGLKTRALVDQWAWWQAIHLGPAMQKLSFELFLKEKFGMGDPDLTVVEAEEKATDQFLAVLETGLDGKDWIAGKIDVRGTLHLNENARKHLMNGDSLLTEGVTKVEGEFSRGDSVDIHHDFLKIGSSARSNPIRVKEAVSRPRSACSIAITANGAAILRGSTSTASSPQRSFRGMERLLAAPARDRMAQRPAAARSQPPLASRRSWSPVESCSRSVSRTSNSCSSAKAPTFHLATSGERAAGSCCCASVSAAMASGPAGSRTADAGAGNQCWPWTASSSQRARPRANATGFGSSAMAVFRASWLSSAGRALMASAQALC